MNALLYAVCYLLVLPAAALGILSLLLRSVTVDTKTVWGLLWNALKAFGYFVDRPVLGVLLLVTAITAGIGLFCAGAFDRWRPYGYLCLSVGGALGIANAFSFLGPPEDAGGYLMCSPMFAGILLSAYLGMRELHIF